MLFTLFVRVVILLSLIVVGVTNSCYSQLWQDVGGGTSFNVRNFFNDTINNVLHVSGQFRYVNDTLETKGYAIWNGNQWLIPEAELDNYCVFANCQLINSVVVYNDTTYASGIYGDLLWKNAGNQWVPTGYPNAPGRLSIANDKLFFTGIFQNISDQAVAHISVLESSEWIQFGEPLDFLPFHSVNGVIYYQGNYYFYGNFNLQNGLNEIILWNGSEWESLAGGITGNSWVNKTAVFQDLLFVGGYFFASDGNASDFLACWNGDEWLDPFPNVTFFAQVLDLYVSGEKLYILAPFTFEGSDKYYAIGVFDGNEFCTIGGYGSFFDTEIDVAVGKIVVFDDNIIVSGKSLFGQSFPHISQLPLTTPFDTCITVQSITSVSPRLTNSLSIFPNPTSSHLTLTGSALLPGSELKVYNVAGQQVYSEVLPYAHETHILDARRFGPAGMYLLHLNTPGHTPVVKKVVVQE